MYARGKKTRLTCAAVWEWTLQVNVGCARPVVGPDPCQGSTSRRRASGHGRHGGEGGGGTAGAVGGRGGEGDDDDAILPPLGPQGPPDPPPPIHSLPGLACPLSPSPLAHCELQQTKSHTCKVELLPVTYLRARDASTTTTTTVEASRRYGSGDGNLQNSRRLR